MEYRINLTDDTVEKLGTALGEPIEELEQEILDKEQEIKEKDETIAEKQAIIDAFPTIESKSITANGTYSEEGKAYSPVVVNVPPTVEVEALNVTQNGTYSQSGKAYSPVTVNVPDNGYIPELVKAFALKMINNGTGSNDLYVRLFLLEDDGNGNLIIKYRYFNILAGRTRNENYEVRYFSTSNATNKKQVIVMYAQSASGTVTVTATNGGYQERILNDSNVRFYTYRLSDANPTEYVITNTD